MRMQVSLPTQLGRCTIQILYISYICTVQILKQLAFAYLMRPAQQVTAAMFWKAIW